MTSGVNPAGPFGPLVSICTLALLMLFITRTQLDQIVLTGLQGGVNCRVPFPLYNPVPVALECWIDPLLIVTGNEPELNNSM